MQFEQEVANPTNATSGDLTSIRSSTDAEQIRPTLS